MKRYHEESAVMNRRMKVALQYIGADCKYVIPGRMRKKHPLNCGKPGCPTCKGHKLFGHQETRREKMSRLAMSEAFE